MSVFGSALRRAGELFVEPASPAGSAHAGPLEICVTPLVRGAGATTVSRGLALTLQRSRPAQLLETAGATAVAAGPGTAVVADADPGDPGVARHRGPGRVLVAVADARRPPPLAALVRDVLAARNERVVLVANRAHEVDAWSAAGAFCVPESRLGAWLLGHGRRPLGAMGRAFDALSVRVQEVAR